MNHEVLNQPPPLANIDLFSTDRALRQALEREGAGWAAEGLAAYGRKLGSAEYLEAGALANAHPPVLHTHDRYGNRRDEVEFHPSWHQMTRLAVELGVHSSPWANPRPGAHVARAAAAMLASECEAGHVCPISMTYSSVPVVRHDAELARLWEPRIFSTKYETVALIGMAMTEKQGGSDVRANTTTAQPVGGGEYVLNGHKWFCSAPMSDAFLVLAQAPGGLSCFFLPRGKGFQLQRLKSKLGNRSNASSEVEFHNALARRIGEEGRGVATIIEMVHHTRLDCIIGATALMRRALIESLHHARHRAAFGRKLIDQPLMRNVLADLTIESEAATVLMMRLARAVDEGDKTFARLAVSAGKYWVSKRCPPHVAEALECLGGNGFVEESSMPRLYREAPLNSIWEGSGNVIALDVLRAVRKDPEAFERVLAEIRLANDPRVERFIGGARPGVMESEARRFTELLAVALEASLLIRFCPPAISDAFCVSRLEGDAGRAFGTLPHNVDWSGILDA